MNKHKTPSKSKEARWFEAAQSGDVEGLREMLALGIAIDSKNKMNSTALMLAAKKGRVDSARFLIEAGAYVNERGASGKTALIVAAEFGRTECVALLLEKGAGVNDKDIYGHTALIKAVGEGRTECAKFLIPLSNIDEVSRDGESALSVAAITGYGEIMRSLIKAGATIDLPDIGGKTPLMRSVISNDLKGIGTLLEAGANPNAIDEYSNTPLHFAAGMGHEACVKILLPVSYINEKERLGLTARDCASKNGYESISELIDGYIRAREELDRFADDFNDGVMESKNKLKKRL